MLKTIRRSVVLVIPFVRLGKCFGVRISIFGFESPAPGGAVQIRPGGVPGRRVRSSRIPHNPLCAPEAGWHPAVPKARYSERGLFALLNLLFVLHSPWAASPLWSSPRWCCPDSCTFERLCKHRLGSEERRCKPPHRVRSPGMPLVIRIEQRGQRPGIHQNGQHHSPNPFMYLGLVARSRGSLRLRAHAFLRIGNALS